jgi:hypothetical protein
MVNAKPWKPSVLTDGKLAIPTNPDFFSWIPPNSAQALGLVLPKDMAYHKVLAPVQNDIGSLKL